MPFLDLGGMQIHIRTRGNRPLTGRQIAEAKRVWEELHRERLIIEEIVEGAIILRRQYPAEAQAAAGAHWDALREAARDRNLAALEEQCRLMAQALDAADRALDAAPAVQLALLNVTAQAAPNAINL